MLRLAATIKLKITPASQIFKRFNSYTKQHKLYQALKAYGRIIKSLFILTYIDDVELRQTIEKQLNKVEHSHKFASAVLRQEPGVPSRPTKKSSRRLKHASGLSRTPLSSGTTSTFPRRSWMKMMRPSASKS